MSAPPPMAFSTANWHWKNKNITTWAKEWMERELTSLTIAGDQEGEMVSITQVIDVDGDVELGQRKSKLITIFDCKVTLKWAGKTSEGTDVEGSLTIPEVSHEIICDNLSDFAYNWTLSTAASPEVNAIFALAQSRLPVAIETKLATFPSAIIDSHGKDLTISADPSRTGTPAPTNTPPGPLGASTSQVSTPVPVKSKPKAAKVNSATVVVEADFRASGDDLFGLLTDEKRIPAWTRASAQSNPQPGSDYSLFGGGVKGKYVSLTPNKEIVQTWALQSPTWPSRHEAILTTSLNQASDSTKVTFTLAGVPTGMEDEIKRNIEGYYIHGFKSIGYVRLFSLPPVHSSSFVPNRTPSRNYGFVPFTSFISAVFFAIVIFAAAFVIPYLSSHGARSRR